MTHSCIVRKIHLPGKGNRSYVRQDCKLVAKTCSTDAGLCVTCSTSPYSRKKISKLVKNFHEENFHRLLAGATKDAMFPNFAEKTFTNTYKTSNFTKVFSLESFPLHGTHKDFVVDS